MRDALMRLLEPSIEALGYELVPKASPTTATAAASGQG